MARTRRCIPLLGLAVLLAACGGATTAPTGAGAGASNRTPDPAGTPAPSAAAGGGGAVTGSVTDAETPQDLLALLPEELCGIKAGGYAFTGAEWLQDQDAAIAAVGTAGKNLDDVIAATRITAGGPVCNATLVRVKGATPDQVLAINEQPAVLMGPKETTVDGRKVWTRTTELLTSYFYTVDDVLLFASALDDAHAREALAALPGD